MFSSNNPKKNRQRKGKIDLNKKRKLKLFYNKKRGATNEFFLQLIQY